MPSKITIRFLKKVCKLNPSPWDDERFMLRSPTLQELLEIPETFTVIDTPDLPGSYPDQGSLGWCVGWSWSLFQRVTNTFLDGVPDILSAMDNYRKAQKYDDLPDFIEGSTNLGGAKALHKEGICTEKCWPTITSKSQDSGKPCAGYGSPEETFGIDQYYMLPVTWGSIKAAMWGTTSEPQWGGRVPVVIGIQILKGWTTVDESGIVPDPLPGEPVMGNHSTLITGITKIDGKLYLENLESWGKDEGNNGKFLIPESYVTGGHIMDAWVGHNGDPIGPNGSECPVGRGIAWAYNKGNALIGGKTRLRAVV